jgi:predicted transcriptional regulator
MDKKLFEDLGLTKNEATIYISLIQYGESTANTVSERTGLHRGYCYDTLSKLANKGIVSYAIKSGKKHFKGVHPKKFLDIIKEKEEKVKELIPELLTMYNQKKSDYEIEILEGTNGLKTFHENLFSYFEKKKIPLVYEIGRKVSLVDNHPMQVFFSNLIKRAKKSGFFHSKEYLKSRIQYLWDHSTKKEDRLMKKFSDLKYLPIDFETHGIDITIIEDNVYIQNYKDKPFVITIKNKEISKFFIQMFKQIWKVSEK